jgi:hypothetical protein
MKGMTMSRHAEAFSALTLLSVLLGGCCQGGQPCQSIGPSTGEIVGIAVGIGAAGAIGVGTAVAVHNDHHNLKGCVSTGPDGLQLTKESDKKTYSLVGVTADIKPGEKVRLHGTKQKKQKGSPGNPQFLVDKVTKNLGPCEAVARSVAPSSDPGH